MFYDLNIPWADDDVNLSRTLAFVAELGYNTIALAHTLSGKLPAEPTCPIPSQFSFSLPAELRLLSRCTLVLSDSSQIHRLGNLAQAYDILAIRPTNEKLFQQVCQTLECDLISLDLTQRLPFHFKFKTLAAALQRGLKFEICYGPAILAVDSAARRNLISNVTQLIRASRGRGLVLSSEAKTAAALRAPADVINLTAVWGLGAERGREAVGALARSVVMTAQMRRRSYRGVVDVVYGGENQTRSEPPGGQGKKVGANPKRKADDLDQAADSDPKTPQTISKREMKRQAAKKAKLAAVEPVSEVEQS